MITPTTDLLLLEDLGDTRRSAVLADADRTALHAVGDWIEAFVVRPHPDLGRGGPVCPFVPEAVRRRTLRLAPQHVGDLSTSQVVELMDGYKRVFLATNPTDGDDLQYKVIVVVFTDLEAGRARGLFEEVQQQLAVQSYAEDGIIFGPFFEGNTGTAIYNSEFRPFQSPVPFLFVRQTVVDDWKFFLEDPKWLGLWARRFGDAGLLALADELRRLRWNARRD